MIMPKPLVSVFCIAMFVGAVFAQSPGLSPLNSNQTMDKNTARVLLAQAKKSALGIPNSFQRGLLLDEIGVGEVALGDIAVAVETANQAYPHDMSTLTAIGKALGAANDLETAAKIEPKLRGGSSSTVFAFVAQTQAEKGNISEALRTTERIKAPEVRADALEWIAERQVIDGDFAGARQTEAQAKATDPSRRSSGSSDEMYIAEFQLSRGQSETARALIIAIKTPAERAFAMVGAAASSIKAGDRVSAASWLAEAYQQLSPGPEFDLVKYFAIPIEVQLGQKERAISAAGALSGERRVEGYMAVAVTCAEQKDIPCVDRAIGKMRSAVSSDGDRGDVSQFGFQLLILNVAAALIQNGEFELSLRLISAVEQYKDDSRIKVHAQLQRVFVLAKTKQFRDARMLALQMRQDSVDENDRGEALRTIALLQTAQESLKATESWASTLTDGEDRAYALLGIVQALLNIGEAKLHYSTLQVH